MSQSEVERFVPHLQGKPVPKKPSNENDATVKTAEDRVLSDADLERVSGGAAEDLGRSNG